MHKHVIAENHGGYKRQQDHCPAHLFAKEGLNVFLPNEQN